MPEFQVTDEQRGGDTSADSQENWLEQVEAGCKLGRQVPELCFKVAVLSNERTPAGIIQHGVRAVCRHPVRPAAITNTRARTHFINVKICSNAPQCRAIPSSLARSRAEESLCETSRRRSDAAIFSNFTAGAPADDPAKNAHISRIRRERAAKMRVFTSLNGFLSIEAKMQEQAAQGPGVQCAVGPSDALCESESVEIPDVETRDPAEEALLLGCSNRLAEIKVGIDASDLARETAGIPALLSAFQQLCLNRAEPRHSRLRSSILQELGLQVRARIPLCIFNSYSRTCLCVQV